MVKTGYINLEASSVHRVGGQWGQDEVTCEGLCSCVSMKASSSCTPRALSAWYVFPHHSCIPRIGPHLSALMLLPPGSLLRFSKIKRPPFPWAPLNPHVPFTSICHLPCCVTLPSYHISLNGSSLSGTSQVLLNSPCIGRH